MDYLQNIESEFNHIESIRATMIQAKKIQLHSGIDGFNSPESYGIYRHTGGDCLGVTGKVFEPLDLNILLDSVTASITECCNDQLNLNELEYKEFKGGSKVSLIIPLKHDHEIKTRLVGDLIKSKISVNTGFDGLTKTSLNFITTRLVCTNGMTSDKSIGINFKNTFKNHSKVFYLCNEIIQGINDIENYITDLSNMAKVEVNSKLVDTYIQKVTGYTVKENEELTTRKRNILDKINESVAIEMQCTGNNLFSLYEGITRYTTHDLAGGSLENIMYSNAATLNASALKEAMLILN